MIKLMKSKPVVIIGAGIGGLTTGTLLAKKGVSVEIFEKSKQIGGRTAAVTSVSYTHLTLPTKA